jgi:hypothetical protein
VGNFFVSSCVLINWQGGTAASGPAPAPSLPAFARPHSARSRTAIVQTVCPDCRSGCVALRRLGAPILAPAASRRAKHARPLEQQSASAPASASASGPVVASLASGIWNRNCHQTEMLRLSLCVLHCAALRTLRTAHCALRTAHCAPCALRTAHCALRASLYPLSSVLFSWTAKSGAPPPPLAVRRRKPNSSRQMVSVPQGAASLHQGALGAWCSERGSSLARVATPIGRFLITLSDSLFSA